VGGKHKRGIGEMTLCETCLQGRVPNLLHIIKPTGTTDGGSPQSSWQNQF
jgi:hypothetical protein